ncbi:MAG TPA: hypothetical protein VFZ00_10335 [Solirubrobacter sp.]|nr:hypothetical protein [Solirubrobacter sp.]
MFRIRSRPDLWGMTPLKNPGLFIFLMLAAALLVLAAGETPA